jgi:fructosamine-3-kinase
MTGQGDVSWALVEQVVRDWLGESARLNEVSFLAGGIVNTTLAVKLHDGLRAVLKVSPHRVNYSHERESRALDHLAGLGITVPKVLASHTATLDKPHSYLILQFIEGMTLRDAVHTPHAPDAFDEVQRELAEATAAMHAQTGPHYGKIEGDTFTEWPVFFRSLVEPVWNQAKEMACLPVKVRKTIGRVHERLDRLLEQNDRPRLCHGDFWAANVLCHHDHNGRWRLAAILDPELRYGHSEFEIAYMDLFKTITPRFKQVYQTHFRLSDRYHTVRKPVYQLYGLINQLQLHGPGFVTPVLAAAEKLAAIV